MGLTHTSYKKRLIKNFYSFYLKFLLFRVNIKFKQIILKYFDKLYTVFFILYVLKKRSTKKIKRFYKFLNVKTFKIEDFSALIILLFGKILQI